MQAALRHGLTVVVSRESLARYRRLADACRMPLRIHAMADGDNAAFADLCRGGLYHHESGRLQMRTIKLYADGALGSRDAALIEPCSDASGSRVLMLAQPDPLQALVESVDPRLGLFAATTAPTTPASRSAAGGPRRS